MESKVTISEVLQKARKYLKHKNNIVLIQRAYEFAEEHHRGQFRKSGDPYIQHPLEIANMLVELHTSPITISAGLLHDLVEDTEVTVDQIKALFGDDVASIVDGVTKIGKLKYMTKEKALAKSHQKILLAMAKDIRVILVKLIDRVHNMRTLEYQVPEKQKVIAKETLDLYAPLAHRLGMYRIKAELEDSSFKYLNPIDYNRIYNLVRNQREAREEDINHMEEQLEQILNTNFITNYEIKGRIKNVYSVCKKMETKNLDFEQIYDLLALRILVNTVEECYRVLGLVHGQWAPIPKRFKDYIAIPKPNLYQSLHTTIVGSHGKIYEIQIRTYEMDKVAELGIAAHWAYKEDNGYSPEKEQLEVSAKLKWYKDLLTYAEIGQEEDNDPLDTIKEDIFSANVYVFTPKGDVFDFPNGATPLDFAYRVHTEVGNHTVGALVNGKIVPLTYKLKTGDVIEIKTSKNFNGPNEAWLKIIKTSHARHKIIAILNKQKRDQLIIKGKDEFIEVIKAESSKLPFEIKLNDKLIADNFSKSGIDNLEDFYYEIGKGTISARGAINKICGTNVVDIETMIRQYNENEHRHHSSSNAFGIIVEGLNKAQIKLANCCHPIMGDNIIGYVSKGHGIVVHRLECHNNSHSEEERFIDVIWDQDIDRTYESLIYITSFDRKNIVAEMINTINSQGITITAISSTKNREGDLVTKIKLLVKNVDSLNVTITNLYKVTDVYNIERVTK